MTSFGNSSPWKGRVLLMLLSGGAAACMLLASTAPAWARTAQAEQRPLAYLRRLAVARVVLAVPPGEAPTPRPARPRPGELEAWQRREAARGELERLRSASGEMLTDAILERLRGLAGLDIVPLDAEIDEGGFWQFAVDGHPPTGEPDPRHPAACELKPAIERVKPQIQSLPVDGLLLVAVEDVGVSGGIERTVWMRCVAFIVRRDTDEVRGPYKAAGWSRAFRRLVGKGYQRSDDRLLAAAAQSAARQLAHTLATGEASPFASPHRVVVLPSVLPEAIPKVLSGVVEVPRRLPALRRQADVLLQPDAGPVVKVVPATVAANLLPEILPPGATLWTTRGDPDLGTIEIIANAMRAAYVFVSRVTEVRLTEWPIKVHDGAVARDGHQREIVLQAEAAFVRAADKAILWRDKGSASFVSRTEYFRGRPRLLTDEQLVVDAARAAFGQLRSRFEEFRKRFEK